MFQQFAKILGSSDLRLEIGMNLKDGVMTVSVLPVNLKKELADIRAIMVSGTPEELESGFFGIIHDPLATIITANNNIAEVLKDVKKATSGKPSDKTIKPVDKETPAEKEDEDQQGEHGKTQVMDKVPEPVKQPEPKKLSKKEIEEQKKKDEYNRLLEIAKQNLVSGTKEETIIIPFLTVIHFLVR